MALKIVLAVGHNWAKNPNNWAIDQWAVSRNSETEAQISLNIIKQIIAKNNNPNIEFYLVPKWKSITDRQEYIKNNKNNMNAYFEFHLNAWGGSWAETFYTEWYSWAKEQAKKFNDAYSNYTKLKNRWAKSDSSTRHWQIWVLRTASSNWVFALLFELGFIDNDSDLKIVKEKAVQWFFEWLYTIWPEYRK